MSNKASTKEDLSPKQRDELQGALEALFEKNLGRHQGLVWAKVQARSEVNPDKLWSLAEMERTGGEPDVVGGQGGRVRFHGLRDGKSGRLAQRLFRPLKAGCPQKEAEQSRLAGLARSVHAGI